jgi:hypothetical protein
MELPLISFFRTRDRVTIADRFAACARLCVQPAMSLSVGAIVIIVVVVIIVLAIIGWAICGGRGGYGGYGYGGGGYGYGNQGYRGAGARRDAGWGGGGGGCGGNTCGCNPCQCGGGFSQGTISRKTIQNNSYCPSAITLRQAVIPSYGTGAPTVSSTAYFGIPSAVAVNPGTTAFTSYATPVVWPILATVNQGNGTQLYAGPTGAVGTWTSINLADGCGGCKQITVQVSTLFGLIVPYSSQAYVNTIIGQVLFVPSTGPSLSAVVVGALTQLNTFPLPTNGTTNTETIFGMTPVTFRTNQSGRFIVALQTTAAAITGTGSSIAYLGDNSEFTVESMCTPCCVSSAYTVTTCVVCQCTPCACDPCQRCGQAPCQCGGNGGNFGGGWCSRCQSNPCCC